MFRSRVGAPVGSGCERSWGEVLGEWPAADEPAGSCGGSWSRCGRYLDPGGPGGGDGGLMRGGGIIGVGLV